MCGKKIRLWNNYDFVCKIFIPEKGGKSEAEIKEEEELQLAIALSQSEAEEKEKQKLRSTTQILNKTG